MWRKRRGRIFHGEAAAALARNGLTAHLQAVKPIVFIQSILTSSRCE
jgi:hypothetical protein